MFRFLPPLTCLLQITATFTFVARAEQPNVVFILSDDQGYADAGFMGATEIRTPHLNRLARGGTVLESFYVQPVCSPTRASLMTGRYVSRTGVYHVVRPNAHWGLPLSERTLADALRDAGYQTAICGKWHLGEFQPNYWPTQRGFDLQYGHWFGAIDYFTHVRDGQRDWRRNDRPCDDKGYSTHLIAAEACRIIREKTPDEPLFLYVPFNAVHSPHQVPEKYTQPFTNLSGVRRTYAGMVAAMDEAVGQIVAALDDKGLLDNTLIIFSSDNGGPAPGKVTSNGPLRAGKGTIYEGGIRVCAFAAWPGHIPSGKRNAEPMHIVDWYPTLVKLAGGSLEQPLPLDGRGIWPVLTQGAKSPHEVLFLPGMAPDQAAIRKGDWKLLIKSGANGRKRSASSLRGEAIELYNLSTDIGETKNIADENSVVANELQSLLTEWLKPAVPQGDPKLQPGGPASNPKKARPASLRGKSDKRAN